MQDACVPAQNSTLEPCQVTFMVNDGVTPVYEMMPGETRRFRVLIATTEDLVGFEVIDEENNSQQMWNTASDGISFPFAVERWKFVMGGGQREDILWQAPVTAKQGSRFYIVQRNISTVQYFGTGNADTTLATIKIVGAPVRAINISADYGPGGALSNFTGEKKPILASEIKRRRLVTFDLTQDMSKTPFPQFHVNGLPYCLGDITSEMVQVME